MADFFLTVLLQPLHDVFIWVQLFLPYNRQRPWYEIAEHDPKWSLRPCADLYLSLCRVWR